MTSKLAFLTPCLALALGSSPVSAAPISWTADDITNDVTNVSTDGTLVDARNGATSDRIVNGVTFLSVENSGNLTDSIFKNDNIGSRGGGNVVTGDYAGFLGQGQRSGRYGFGPAQGAYIEPTEDWATINFSGLTVGNTYQIQIWASDNADATPLNKALVLGNGSAGSPETTDTFIYHETTDGGAGQYGTGVFVADATTQSFNIRQRINLTTTAAWVKDMHWSNGWQIRDLGADASPPNPDPMTWASAPAAVNDSTITMTATTATDQTGVEYQFTRYAADGTSLLFTSPWQDSPEYTDTGLSGNTTYTYTVTARDKTPSQHTTTPSTPVAPATTPTLDVTPPDPSPLTWASVPTALGYSAITMTANTASDPSGVEYYFTCTAGGGIDSGWQDSPEYTDSSVIPSTTYSYTVRARDKSAGQNEGAASSEESATTIAKGSATIAWTANDITPNATDVSNAGTLVEARAGGNSDVTVNTVTFKSVENSGNLFDSVFGFDGIGARGHGAGYVTDAGYRGLLGAGHRSGRTGFNEAPRIENTEVWTTIDFSGLTVGNTYQIQIWHSDGNFLNPTSDGVFGNSGLLLGDGSAGDPDINADVMILSEAFDNQTSQYGGTGQFGLGTFVANATNQSFNLRSYNNLLETPTPNPSLHFSNGWQIRDLGVIEPTGYIGWADGNIGGAAANVDSNGDGVDNGIAYFMNNAGVITLPGSVSGTITWTNGGNIASTEYGSQFKVQTSADLATWDDVLAGDPNLSNTAGSVAYTLPTGAGKLFARLVVTPN